MNLKSIKIAWGVMFILFCANVQGICSEETINQVYSLLDNKILRFSSQDNSLENFACDMSLFLKGKDVIFKICYEKDNLFTFSCFNKKNIELFAITEDRICFFSQGKYLSYPRKDYNATLKLFLDEDEITFKFGFKKKAAEFLIDFSKIGEILTEDIATTTIKQDSSKGTRINYQINIKKEKADRVSETIVSLDDTSDTFSSFEIITRDKRKTEDVMNSIKIHNISFNDPNFEERIKDQSRKKELFIPTDKIIYVEDENFPEEDLIGLIIAITNEFGNQDDVHYYNGLMQMSKGNATAAIDNLKKAIDVDKKNIKAYELLLELYMSQEDFENAFLYAQKGLKIFPQNIMFICLKGVSLAYSGKYKEAEEILLKVLTQNKTGRYEDTVRLALAMTYLGYRTKEYDQKALDELNGLKKILSDQEKLTDVDELIKAAKRRLEKKKGK